MSTKRKSKDTNVSNFKLLKSETITELKYLGTNGAKSKKNAHLYKHKSGAKLIYLENDDPELAFTIGFKTQPNDDTGVFHILEHSVLCGSKHYPVKEPFSNLLKSSMQTFLNAMTFPDKTIYPVATTNLKDFYNLISVYMDAVTFPNIYVNKNIFYQEGGHKTLDGFNGVVFNEMQGCYSQPQEYLFEGVLKQLFPKTTYSYSYGGKPSKIKSLTYQKFINQHAKNYVWNNSYIIVYGNLEINDVLNFLDDNYLSKTKQIKQWRSQAKPKNISKAPLKQKAKVKYSYKKISIPINNPDTYCAAAFAIQRNQKEILGVKVLLEALTSSNESRLKKALIDKNIADDINFEFILDVYNPIIYIEAKNLKAGLSKNFKAIIIEEIEKILSVGISKKHIKAAISNIEFKQKDKEPDCTFGLDTIISAMTEWIYAEDDPFAGAKYIDNIVWLKKQTTKNYFNSLAKKIFIDNCWCTCVEVVSDKKPKKETKIKYSKSEMQKINDVCANLKKWQTTPDSKEDVEKLPVLNKSDIGNVNPYPKWKIYNKKFKYLKYDINTNGISHVNRYYSFNSVKFNEISYVAILSEILAKLDTDKHSSNKLDLLIQDKLGRITFSCNCIDNKNNIRDVKLMLTVNCSTLDKNTKYAASIIDEIIYGTKFENKEKIKTILVQKKTELEQNFISMGHIASINNAMANLTPAGKAKEMLDGVDLYKFIKTILGDYDKQFPVLSKTLQRLSKNIFKLAPTISFAGSVSSFNKYNDTISNKFTDKKATINKRPTIKLDSKPKDCAYFIPSDVNYCAFVSDLRLSKKENSGKLITASKIIWLDYLWNEVRVKNGAYGSGMIINTFGNIQFYSFRDPNTTKTFSTYKNSLKWLSKLDIDTLSLNNYIISCVAKIDAPRSPRAIMFYQDNCYFGEIPSTNRINMRRQMLNTKQKDLKEAAKLLNICFNKSSKCVFGGNDVQKLSKNQYKIINLFGC